MPRLCDNDGRVAGSERDGLDGRAGATERSEDGIDAQARDRIGRSEADSSSSSATGWADGPTPAAPPPGVPASAERFFQEGLDAQKKKDWRRRGPVLRGGDQAARGLPGGVERPRLLASPAGQVPDAIKAYDRALKLRPDYAEALEYLGEAYVKMGKLDEARAVLGRLEPLDKKEAAELRAAIDKAKK